jgi:hypothetical protein
MVKLQERDSNVGSVDKLCCRSIPEHYGTGGNVYHRECVKTRKKYVRYISYAVKRRSNAPEKRIDFLSAQSKQQISLFLMKNIGILCV